MTTGSTGAQTMDSGVTIGARLLLALAVLLAAVATPVAAQGNAAAGRFIAVTGDVKVLGSDGVTRIAVRNGEIRQGDSIVTGADSLAQLRMSDGGAVSVRADTQLKLDSYRFTTPEDRDSSFAVSIIKGGFRVLTGLIARTNRQNYRVSTSAMTIGVRGTHFEVVHVLQPVADAAAGTYNRVYDGTISVQNRAGASVVVSPGQTVFVALPSNLPPVLVAPPVGIFGRPTPVPQAAPVSRRDEVPAEGAKPAAHSAREGNVAGADRGARQNPGRPAAQPDRHAPRAGGFADADRAHDLDHHLAVDNHDLADADRAYDLDHHLACDHHDLADADCADDLDDHLADDHDDFADTDCTDDLDRF